MDDLSIAMGQGRIENNRLVLEPDASGRVYLTFNGRDLDLAEHTQWRVSAHSSHPWETFIVWKTRKGGEQRFQYKLPKPLRYNPIVASTRDVEGWRGNATQFGLGFRIPAGNRLVLEDIRVKAPGLADTLEQWNYEWSSLTPWQAADINLYTGTRYFEQGQHPVVVFALLAAGFLMAFLLAGVLYPMQRATRWAGAGVIVLSAWILLDLFWQVRLWRQLELTREVNGGKTTEERILASDDGPLWTFAESVKPLIPERIARVFVASDTDQRGLLTTYYLTPRNTSWNRRSALLPGAETFRNGDYIALIHPVDMRYLPDQGGLRLKSGELLPVEHVWGNRDGDLFRVIAE